MTKENICPGTKLYRYTVRNGKFFIHEGVVNDNGIRMVVNFADGSFRQRCPRVEDIGIIRNTGPSLWLTDRDDELARQIFLDFEEAKLKQLYKQVETKIDIIKMLKGLEE